MYVVIFIYFSVEFEQKNTQPPFPAFPPYCLILFAYVSIIMFMREIDQSK